MRRCPLPLSSSYFTESVGTISMKACTTPAGSPGETPCQGRAWRLPPAGVADDEQLAPGVPEGDLAGRLAVRVDHVEGSDRAAVTQLVVESDAVLPDELGVAGMDCDARAGAIAQLRRGAEMI